MASATRPEQSRWSRPPSSDGQGADGGDAHDKSRHRAHFEHQFVVGSSRRTTSWCGGRPARKRHRRAAASGGKRSRGMSGIPKPTSSESARGAERRRVMITLCATIVAIAVSITALSAPGSPATACRWRRAPPTARREFVRAGAATAPAARTRRSSPSWSATTRVRGSAARR